MKVRHYYNAIREAAYVLADVDSSESADAAFHKADRTLLRAVRRYTRMVLCHWLAREHRQGDLFNSKVEDVKKIHGSRT